MKANRIRQNVFPVLAALIWGTAFVAQSVGADYVEPFTFNTARSAIAFLFLLALCGVFSRLRRRDFSGEAQARPASRRDLMLGGVLCGVALTVATNLQQKGLETTSLRQGGLYHGAVYRHCAGGGAVFEEKGPRHHLDQRSAGRGGLVLPVHQ